MIEVNKYYYASTPRSEKQNRRERIKVLEITGNIIKCITVEELRREETYLLDISKITQ